MTTEAVPARSATTARFDEAPVGFRDGVTVDTESGKLRILSAGGCFALRGLSDGVREAVIGLTVAPASPALLAAQLTPAEQTHLRQILTRLGRLLTRYVVDGERLLVRIEQTASDAGHTPAKVPADAWVKLSKFALLRSRNGRLVLECPLATHRVEVLDQAVATLLLSVSTGSVVADLVGELPAGAVAELLGTLVGAGFVEVGEPDGETVAYPSDHDATLRQWDFHDLLFHSRSRFGRFDEPFGGIFPYVGEIDPQPAVKQSPAGPSVPLPEPALADVLSRDLPLTTVLEGRTSVRKYDARPMTIDQLGEFLYRTARVRATYGPVDGMPYQATTRPYPCGGAAYELELYVTVRRCEGLTEGVYYYDAVEHRLVLVNEDPADREAMLHTASVATAMQATPDVLLTMTSRFQRLSWKYRAIAYAVTLKHAGVLYQTMYLVATAMGLAPCGLGSGDSELAGRVLGLDRLHESSVGEFILGSRPAVDASERPVLPEHWQSGLGPDWAVASQSALREQRARR